jgi:lysophospholipase L1-like esterase
MGAEASGSRAGGAGRRVGLVALGLGLALGAVLFGEGIARLAAGAPPPDPADEAWMAYSPEVGWLRRPRFAGEAFGAVRAFDRDGLFPPDAAGLRPRPRRVVLALGDSRTFGVGVPFEQSWVEQLEGRLADTEVVNLGVPGYTAWQGRATLERWAAALRPDAVVAAFGFNERRAVAPGEEDGSGHFLRLAWGGTWRRLARRSALAGSLMGPPSPTRGGALDLATVVPRLPVEGFREQLAAVAAFCARNRIRLLLLWLPDDPRLARDLRRGVRAARAGRREDARRHLEQAVAADAPFSDAARLALAEVLRAAGDSEAARRVAVSPRSLRSTAGGYPLLADLDYRAALLEVAAAHGVEVADAGPVLTRRSGVYLDYAHFDARGHRAVAELLAERLGAEP